MLLLTVLRDENDDEDDESEEVLETGEDAVMVEGGVGGVWDDVEERKVGELDSFVERGRVGKEENDKAVHEGTHEDEGNKEAVEGEEVNEGEEDKDDVLDGRNAGNFE